MPHINIKCYPGRTEEQKRLLAERITQDVVEVFQTSAESVSVSIQDVARENWDEEVWDKEIEPQKDYLYKKPGYTKNATPAPSLGDRLFIPFTTAAVVCVLAAMIFTMIDMRVSAVLTGILFTIFGFIALAKIKITHKTWEIVLLPVIGVPLAMIPGYLMLSEHFPEKFPLFGEITKLMFWGVLAIIVGLGMFVIAIASRARLKKHCTVEVNAVCIDFVELRSRGICLYRAVWEYCVNGQTYKNMDKVSSLKRKPELGHQQTIMIDPTDPDEFYRRESAGYIMFMIMGVSLLLAGGIILSGLAN